MCYGGFMRTNDSWNRDQVQVTMTTCFIITSTIAKPLYMLIYFKYTCYKL